MMFPNSIWQLWLAQARNRIRLVRLFMLLLLAPIALIATNDAMAAAPPVSAIVGQANLVVKDLTAEVEGVSSTGKAVPKATVSTADPKKWDIQLTPTDEDQGKQIVITYKLKGSADQVSQVVFVVNSTSLWGDSYGPVFKALFALFVVAVLLELGLGLLFNWSKFLAVFDAKGVKTIVSFVVALALVNSLGLDILSYIVALIWNPQVKSELLTKVLSAMVLAGGSSVVNTLFISLGFRSPRTAESAQAKPPPTKAWISVKVVREMTKQNTSSVTVSVKQRTATGMEDFVDVAVFDGNDWRKGPLVWFFRDPLRFPGAGGYSVLPEVPCEIRASTKIGSDVKKSSAGPFTLPAGGMLDIVLRL